MPELQTTSYDLLSGNSLTNDSSYSITLHHSATSTSRFIRFEQRFNGFKRAIFKNFVGLFASFSQGNSKNFHRQTTQKWFRILKPTYIERLASQFRLDLNNSLTFSKKLYLKNIIRLFATINQQNSDFYLGNLQLNGFHLGFYIHSRACTPILIGFGQILDVLK